VELSFGSRWDEPILEGYLAAILDPRFKDLSFELEKFEQTKSKLKRRMKNAQNMHPPSFCETNLPLSLLSSLFGNPSKPICPIEHELKIYFDMPLMTKYDLSDSLYKTHNPLVFWRNNKQTLPLMAQQAR
ncbi:5544_t:CDS:1, partial [Gigaspora rosea]